MTTTSSGPWPDSHQLNELLQQVSKLRDDQAKLLNPPDASARRVADVIAERRANRRQRAADRDRAGRGYDDQRKGAMR